MSLYRSPADKPCFFPARRGRLCEFNPETGFGYHSHHCFARSKMRDEAQDFQPPFFNPSQPGNALSIRHRCSEDQFSFRRDFRTKPLEREPQIIVGEQVNYIEHQHRIDLIWESCRQVRRFSDSSRPAVTEGPVCNPNTFGVRIETINPCLRKQREQPDCWDPITASDIDHLSG